MLLHTRSVVLLFLAAPLCAEEAVLIPRAKLFDNPDRASVQISPDGQRLSFLAPVNGVLNVWVGPAEAPDQAKAVTADKGRGIRQYSWAHDNRHLLYLQDQGGDENWKAFSVDLEDGNRAVDLTPFDTIPGPDGKPLMLPSGKPMRPAAQLQGLSPRHPGKALVGLNQRNPRYHDVHVADLATGKLELLQQNDRYAGFIADEDFQVRFAAEMLPDGGSQIWQLGGKEPTVFEKIGPEDALTTNPIDFDAEGKTLYMTDSRGRDTGALVAVELAGKKATVLAEDARADAGGVMIHPAKKTVQAVSFTYDRTRWKVLDASIQADLDHLKTVADGELSVGSRSLDDRRWVVSAMMDDGPVRYYRYDRPKEGGAGKATFLFTNRKSLEGLPLVKMHAPVIPARDGLSLVSYLSLPPGTDADGDGRPAEALPMVMLVHGGPWARDSWGYNGTHQWLANRGYAVLSVNFRGSTGFGKKFLNAGNLEWAAKMHDDLLDAREWAVAQKIARKDRVAIMGGSYGGYATLVALTFTPDVFTCGVDIVGPSNLVTLLSTIPPYWTPMISVFTKRVGDHRTEEGRKFLGTRSPISFVDKIQRPLLIGQGANDPRVKQAESDQIVQAMQAKKIPVTYVLFPDEGHGFARPENRIAFNAVTEAFLSRHLGGRAEPAGDALKASTAQIKVDGGMGLAAEPAK